MKQKLLVFSADAMVWEDLEYMWTKPNFSRLMARSARVDRVKSVYPSLTYPCHTTILTGCYPDRHGILNNKQFLTWDDGVPHYQTDHALIKVPDLFAAARAQGLTTASVYWPVMGNNPNIDYLINEYFFPYNEDPEEMFRSFGAGEDTLIAIRENRHRLPFRKSRPGEVFSNETEYEDFAVGCACSLIRRYQPDVLLVHNCVLDTSRHMTGVFGPAVERGLDLLDEWLGEIIEAMEDAGVYEDTDFVILSDHGHMNFTRVARPNVLLRQGGFIDVDEDGKVTAWRAFAHSTGMNTMIRLADPSDEALREEVGRFLREAYKQGLCGIQQVYTEAETRERYRLGGDFAYMLENIDDVNFSPAWTGPVISALPRGRGSSHGYLPEKGPWPVFLGAGPSFRPGAVLSMAHLVDEGPTLARVLGTRLPDADGRVLTELLV